MLRKTVLKTHALQTLRDCRTSLNFAKRRECGAFTAASNRTPARHAATRRAALLTAPVERASRHTWNTRRCLTRPADAVISPNGVPVAGLLDGFAPLDCGSASNTGARERRVAVFQRHQRAVHAVHRLAADRL